MHGNALKTDLNAGGNMAITTKFLEDLGIEKEVADKIFAVRGEELAKDKATLTAVQAELKEKTEALEKLNSEFETLKANNASGEEWKTKYEALVADNDAKAKQAEADRILKEKTDSINKRFETVLGDKKFNHDAIREAYLKKFSDALENADFVGKSDSEIFHELTKDDGGAFKGVEVVKLAGGKPTGAGSGKYTSRAEIFQIKDAVKRQSAMIEHPDLFPEIQTD